MFLQGGYDMQYYYMLHILRGWLWWATRATFVDAKALQCRG